MPKTASDVPETLFGHLNADGTVSGGIEIPGLASILSDPDRRHEHRDQGLDSFPADERPTTRQVNTVHLAWDVMVGLGTLLFLLSALVRAHVDLPARHPEDASCSSGSPSVAGVASVLAMEAGGWSPRSAANRGSSSAT